MVLTLSLNTVLAGTGN